LALLALCLQPLARLSFTRPPCARLLLTTHLRDRTRAAAAGPAPRCLPCACRGTSGTTSRPDSAWSGSTSTEPADSNRQAPTLKRTHAHTHARMHARTHARTHAHTSTIAPAGASTCASTRFCILGRDLASPYSVATLRSRALRPALPLSHDNALSVSLPLPVSFPASLLLTSLLASLHPCLRLSLSASHRLSAHVRRPRRVSPRSSPSRRSSSRTRITRHHEY